MTTDHNEAMRLADDLDRQWRDDALNYDTAIEAATLIRQQDERIAELEARIHTCGPTCSKAGCINRRLTSERDTLRAEVERLKPNAERYEWLCEKLGETQLPTLIERITRGYVADYKPSIDAAIDTARKATP